VTGPTSATPSDEAAKALLSFGNPATAIDPEHRILAQPREGHHVSMDQFEPRNVDAVLSHITDRWSPRTIAVVNDYDVRVAKVQGEFTPHSHPETDEFFLVLSGCLTIRMDDGDVVLSEGDTYVVPRGRAHQPYAEAETTLLLFEPSETVNTGDTPSSLTARRTVV
jgi:mannose-6-phosphate isomerase-like protein (cupin superfamily)